MDPTLIAKLIANSPLIAMVIGLLLALKLTRSEWLEREKLWKDTNDKSRQENDALQKENLIALREQIKTNLEFAAEIKALREDLRALGKGGA